MRFIMKLFVVLQTGIWFFFLAVFSVQADDYLSVPGEHYIIGRGDVLDVAVWKDDAQTKVVTVLPDGTISLPLVGEIVAAGITVADLKKEIACKVAKYVPDPVLTVIVQQVNSMLIYVIGKVNSPGRLVLNTNVNVMQALTMAGGLNPFAKRDKVSIMRGEGSAARMIDFDYDAVSSGRNLSQNIILQRGDVVVVP
jgi:polysaccharide biosynthesis/export protein